MTELLGSQTSFITCFRQKTFNFLCDCWESTRRTHWKASFKKFTVIFWTDSRNLNTVFLLQNCLPFRGELMDSKWWFQKWVCAAGGERSTKMSPSTIEAPPYWIRACSRDCMVNIDLNLAILSSPSRLCPPNPGKAIDALGSKSFVFDPSHIFTFVLRFLLFPFYRYDILGYLRITVNTSV